jgi:hypothetical protein
MTRKKANKCDWKARALRAEQEAYNLAFWITIVYPHLYGWEHSALKRALDKYIFYLEGEVARGR